jgi:hypothetical protein
VQENRSHSLAAAAAGLSRSDLLLLPRTMRCFDSAKSKRGREEERKKKKIRERENERRRRLCETSIRTKWQARIKISLSCLLSLSTRKKEGRNADVIDEPFKSRTSQRTRLDRAGRKEERMSIAEGQDYMTAGIHNAIVRAIRFFILCSVESENLCQNGLRNEGAVIRAVAGRQSRAVRHEGAANKKVINLRSSSGSSFSLSLSLSVAAASARIATTTHNPN